MIRLYRIEKEIGGRVYAGEIPAESLEEATRQAGLLGAQVTGYTDEELDTCDMCGQFFFTVDKDVLIISGTTDVY